MKKLPLIVLSTLLAASSSLAGKVITYIGFSDSSQGEADNAAYAGLAKQISAEVKVDEKMVENEATYGENFQHSGSYSLSNVLKSNMKLNGVKITTLPRNGRYYKAEASVDLDVLKEGVCTAIMDAIERLQHSESRAWQALEKRQYLIASSAWEDAALALIEYYDNLDILKAIDPSNNSFKISHKLVNLENSLISALSAVTIKISSQEYLLNKPEVQFDVYVSDAHGPLSDFPLQVVQGRYILQERRTGSNGVATMFTDRLVGNSSGLCRLNVRPAGIHKKLLKSAGLSQGRTLDFKLKQAEKPKVQKPAAPAGKYDSRYKFE